MAAEEQIIENDMEFLYQLDYFEDALKKSINNYLKILFDVLHKERNNAIRSKIESLILKLSTTVKERLMIEKHDKKILLERYEGEINLVSKEINYLQEFSNYLKFRIGKINNLKESLFSKNNMLDPQGSFFWKDIKSKSNREKAQRIIPILENLAVTLSEINFGAILRYIINDSFIERFGADIKKHPNSAKTIKKLLEIEISKSAAKKNSAGYIYKQLEALKLGLNKLVSQDYAEFMRHIEAALLERGESINELKRFEEIIKDIEIVKKSKQTIFTNALTRIRIRSRAKYKSLFRKNSLNVVFLGIPTSIKCGVVTSFRQLARVLDKKGINVFIITHWWHKYFFFDKESGKYKREMANIEEKKASRYIKAKSGEAGGYTKVSISPYSLLDYDAKPLNIDYKWAGKSIIEYLRSYFHFKIDIIHAHTHTFAYDKSINIMKEKAGNVPIVYTVHSLIPYINSPDDVKMKITSGYYSQLSRPELVRFRTGLYSSKKELSQETMFRMADKIVFIADIHKTAFDNLYPEYKGKSIAIINGTDMPEYKDASAIKMAGELRKKYAPNDEKLILFSGRIETRKVKSLCKAFNLIFKKYPDARLLFMGALHPKPKNEEEKNMRIKSIKSELVQKFGLAQSIFDYVYILPWIKGKKEIAAHYLMADLVIMPGVSYELYSLSALEAMGLGVPVITCTGRLSIGSSENEYKIFESADYYFKAKDTQEIKDLIRKAEEEVKERYNPQVFLDKHLEIYKELCR